MFFWGLVCAGLGAFLVILTPEVVAGFICLSLGVIGLYSGLASFTSGSPVIKLLEALDLLCLAIFLVVLGLTGTGEDVFGNLTPLIIVLGVPCLVWLGFGDIKGFEQIRARMRKARERAG